MGKYFTFTDFCVIAVCLLLTLGVITLTAEGEEGRRIVIETDGKVYASYDMATLGDAAMEIHINTKYGKNILSIDSEGADMIYSDCDLQVDVKHKKISKPGEAIVCAPHRLTVYIDGKSETDAVSR